MQEVTINVRTKTMRTSLLSLPLLCSALFTAGAFAAESTGDSIWTREHLFGDWGGLRTKLGEHGVGIDIKSSQFYQDVTSGGVDSGNSGEYGRKLDLWVNVDAQKLFNSWEGLSFSMHVENREGKDVLADAGSLVLPNAPLMYPLPGEYDGTDVTGFTVNQTLFGGKAAALAGKLNAFDLLNGFFPHVVDSGLEGFQNANSFMSMLSWGRYLTLSQYGAGAWTIGSKFGAQTGFIVAGGGNTTTTWDTSDSFDGGSSIMGFHRFIHEFDDKPGYVYLAAGGSTKDYPKTDPVDWTFSPAEGIQSEADGKPWDVALYFYQVVWEATPGNDKRFVNIFTGGSFGDDKVSFADWDVFFNIQAFGLLDSRPNDRMGFAAHYYHLADGFVDLVNTAGGGLHDEVWTTEAYYNVQLTPWLHLTPNFQYVQNEQSDDDPAVIIGTRLVVDL